MTARFAARGSALVLLAAALGCAPPRPPPIVRIVAAEPDGTIAPGAARAAVLFSAAVDPAGIFDGSRIVLVREEDVREAALAVESDAGAAGPPAIAVQAGLSPDGARAELTPLAPLVPEAGHAVVVSSRLRSADGGPVLDPDGRRHVFVHLFRTGAAPGPPPLPVLDEILADAATPEAGGEYVEVVNLGEGPLDLRSYRLGKRTAGGAVSSCAIEGRSGGPVPPRGYAIVAGGAYDGRYSLPEGTALYACGATALDGGIADDRSPEVFLLAPDGSVATSLGQGGGAPLCAVVERIHPLGPDAPDDLACAQVGTPGACNAATPAAECP